MPEKSFKNLVLKMSNESRNMTQAVECLISKHEALNSNSNTTKKNYQ
jgi:hypothetical protein